MPKLVRDVDRRQGLTTLRAYGEGVRLPVCVCVRLFRARDSFRARGRGLAEGGGHSGPQETDFSV